MDQNRIARGQGAASGQFTFDIKAQKPVDFEEPPLRDFRIVGYERKIYPAVYGEPTRPAGVCYHCGSGIMNCVVIENPKTGEIVDVGETCAERVGLDMSALKEMLRERNYASRVEADRERQEQSAKSKAAQEAEDTARFGGHGSESRWQSGCRCAKCSVSAPHGQADRLTYGKCYCDLCLQAAIESGQYERETRKKLVDLDTRKVLPAKCVHTKYGLSWVVNDENGSASWFPYSPARRNTLAKRGAVEVEVACLMRRYRFDGEVHYKEVVMLESSGVDIWGEPIDVELN